MEPTNLQQSDTQQTNNATKTSQHIQPAEDNKSLRGTLLSVLFIGGVIIVSWLGVFALFLSRN